MREGQQKEALKCVATALRVEAGVWRKRGGPGPRPKKENTRTGKAAPQCEGETVARTLQNERRPIRKEEPNQGERRCSHASLSVWEVRMCVRAWVCWRGGKRKKGFSACQPRRRPTHQDAQARTERSNPSAKPNFAVVVLCESRRKGTRREWQAEQARKRKRGTVLTQSRVAL